MIEITGQFLVLVPVIVGIVEVLKKVGLTARFAPLVALILGVLGASLLGDFALTGALILEGVVAGLTASGLYSGAKATVSV